MEINERMFGSTLILDLVGDFRDECDKTALVAKLRKVATRDIAGLVVNLEKIEWIDTVGLAALVSTFTKLARQDKKLVLLNVTRRINYLLVVTKLDIVFEIYTNEQAAINSFGPKLNIQYRWVFQQYERTAHITKDKVYSEQEGYFSVLCGEIIEGGCLLLSCAPKDIDAKVRAGRCQKCPKCENLYEKIKEGENEN